MKAKALRNIHACREQVLTEGKIYKGIKVFNYNAEHPHQYSIETISDCGFPISAIIGLDVEALKGGSHELGR